MTNYFAMQWYEKEQTRRNDHQRSNDVHLINQELKRILHRIQSFIDRKDYQKEAQQANRVLVQSNIWDVGYRNNMENLQVALAQAILILTILMNEPKGKIQHASAIETEVERQMRQLGNIDWSFYTTYRRKVQRLQRG